MQELKETHSHATFLKALRRLFIRLHRRASTKSYATEIGAIRQELRDAYENMENATEVRLVAEEELLETDRFSDELIVSLSLLLLSLNKNNRQDPFYTTLFPEAPSKATEGIADDKQMEFLRRVLTTLQTPAYENYRAQADALQNAYDAITTKQAEVTQANDEETQAQLTYEQTKAKAQELYNRTYHRLRADLALPRTLIESLFLTLTPSKKKLPPSEPK